MTIDLLWLRQTLHSLSGRECTLASWKLIVKEINGPCCSPFPGRLEINTFDGPNGTILQPHFLAQVKVKARFTNDTFVSPVFLKTQFYLSWQEKHRWNSDTPYSFQFSSSSILHYGSLAIVNDVLTSMFFLFHPLQFRNLRINCILVFVKTCITLCMYCMSYAPFLPPTSQLDPQSVSF